MQSENDILKDRLKVTQDELAKVQNDLEDFRQRYMN